MRKLGINLLTPSRKISLEGARSFSVLLVMLSPFTAECVFDHQLVNWKVFQSVPHWESNTSQERNRHSILCTLEWRTKYKMTTLDDIVMDQQRQLKGRENCKSLKGYNLEDGRLWIWKGGGAHSFAKGCKFQILVSLRVFWGNCHHM